MAGKKQLYSLLETVGLTKGIEMKQDYTMYIYKTDRRTKTSERLYSTTVWTGRDEAGMQREVEELHLHHYPRSQFRMEYIASMKTVSVDN